MSEFVTIQLPDGRSAKLPKGMTRKQMADALNSFSTDRAPAQNPQNNADMSLFGRIKDNVMGVDDGVMSTGEKIGALLNKGGESMTLGVVGDEADAALSGIIPGGMDYDQRLAHNRGNEAQMEQEHPYLMTGAEIGGGVLGALLPGGAVGNLARGGIAARAAASGAAGAGMGGIYGFMEGEGDSRLKDAQTGAAWGAGAGVAAPVIGGGVKKVADALMQRGPIKQAVNAAKTAAEQRAGSRAAYSAFEGADAQISPDAMTRLRGQIRQRIDSAGAPKIPGPLGKSPKSGRQINQTLGLMDEQVQAAAKSGQNPAVPLKALEDVRKQAGVLSRETKDFRPTQGAYIAQQAIDEIDQFMAGLQQADVPVGDAKTAMSALNKARSMWRSSIKTQMLENASDEADNYLSGTASGLRNQVKSLLRKNKKTKLFSKQEEDALKKVIGNNVVGRGIRTLGDGLGAKMATLGGGATGGIAGAAIGRGASELASNIGDSMATRNMEIAKALISQGKLQNLPQMGDEKRKLIEQLVRRTGVALGQ